MRKSLLLILIFVLAQSCDLLDFCRKAGEVVDVTGDALHGMIVLGDKLEDPYTVENMSKALASVYPTKGRVLVNPTDLYVRFLPKSDEEFEKLERLGVQMLDHPVDYQIVREGDYYHDPSIADEDITWQYAVVKKDFVFPSGIKYELLDECYLPDNDASTKADGLDWDEIEREAYRLTGNEDMLAMTKGDAVSAKPEGRITIIDDLKGETPYGVKGVRVSCNSFVKFANAYTDEEGYYKMSKTFSSDVRYRLVFKNMKGFSIGFNLLLVPASCSSLGKSGPEGVNAQIDKYSEDKLFTRSVVNNAGYDYYESCVTESERMRTPPTNLRIWLFRGLSTSSAPMLQQGAVVDASKMARYLGKFTSLLKMFLPDVTLGLKGAEDFCTIYSTTVHELAHASHFMQVGKEYWDKYIEFIITSFITSGFTTYGVGTEENHGYCEVGEMWAYYLENVFYRERYNEEFLSGTTYWFYPQIMMYMDERGIGRYKIFNALTADITDRDLLQKRLVSLYPECKSMINQAFSRYR